MAVQAPIAQPGPRVNRALLAALPDRLHQPIFARTGGFPAAGLLTTTGELLIMREDVGPHNAIDKVLGRALLDDRMPLTGRFICVSGRSGARTRLTAV